MTEMRSASATCFLSKRCAARAALAAALFASAGGFVGCGGSDKPPPRATRVTPVVRDLPPVLRGLIGSEATFAGVEPTLVTGYGLVVGLNGTGGKMLPSESIAAHMEREMALKGIGRGATLPGTPLSHADGSGKTPREVLSDPSVAVVVVYARIPPGSPEGGKFDVFVQALNADSLEGGTLWTTEMQIGPSEPFGGYQRTRIAEAKGPVFVNPFADPALDAGTGMLNVGRVLNGGTVTQPLEIAISLDNPSHLRARSIAAAINTRFPQSPRDRSPTARGMNDSTVALRVPAEFTENPSDFLQMVQHLPIDFRVPREQYALRFVRAIEEQPGLAGELTWALKALGPDALPEVRKLYDSTELTLRRAGLNVGAFFGDPRAIAPLTRMAESGPSLQRSEAIVLLAEVEGGPATDRFLRGLIDDADPLVRVAAYETLAERAERDQQQRMLAQQYDLASSTGRTLSDAEVQLASQLWLPGNSLQGIERRVVGKNFLIDRVPAGDPLVYVTQQGEPRVALFGEAKVRRPVFATAWSDRLMVASDGPEDPVRVYYRDYQTDRVTVRQVPADLGEFVQFLAHKPTPEDPRPGLGLSYSEVVGALHALWKADGITGEFTTQQDRLLASLLEATRGMQVEERPERPGEAPPSALPLPEIPNPDAPPADAGPRIVPIRPPSLEDGS